MSIVQLPHGHRLLKQDLLMLRNALLFGHGSSGARLPRLNKDLIIDNLLPLMCVPGQQHAPVAAGHYHTCAVQADGQLRCFGANLDGQCDVPLELGACVAVAAGHFHTCVVQASGQLVCFGANSNGQCDPPPRLSQVVAVAASEDRTCAVQADGQLACFGADIDAQSTVPPDLGRVVAVAAGAHHTCVVQTHGGLVCWGTSNFYGQCDVPPELGPVVAVAAGDFHTCALQANGSLVCFGANRDGQCNVPRKLGRVGAVAAGSYHTCAVRADGRLVCFGSNSGGQCDVPPKLGRVMAVAAGERHTCALQVDGSLVCFGNGEHHGHCTVPSELGPMASAWVSCHPVCIKSETSRSSTLVGYSVVNQVVEHVEEAANISCSEAELVVTQQHASGVAHNLCSMTDGSTTQHADADFEPLFLLRFSRSTDQLHAVLSRGDELEPVRAFMSAAGCHWQLPGGAMIFTDPAHFERASMAVNRRALLPCHVVVTQSLEPLVHEAVSRLPSKQKVKVRNSEPVAYLSGAADEKSTLSSYAALFWMCQLGCFARQLWWCNQILKPSSDMR